MNTLVARLQKSLNGLNPRERFIVLGGAMVLLVLGIYLLAWEPLIEKQESLDASIKTQQELHSWMLQSAAKVRQLKGSGDLRRLNYGSMQSVINKTAKAALPGAVIKRVEKNRQQSVQVWIEQVAFDDMVKWLGNLQQKNGVRVTSLVSERIEQAGRVNVRLVLKAG